MPGTPASSNPARLLAIAIGATLVGCGSDQPTSPSAPACDAAPAAFGDGVHALSVQHHDGEVDGVSLYAASPTGEGPFPVVVYARGMGLVNSVNCRPNESGIPSNVQQFIDNVASEGYLAIAISYRNYGEQAPATTSLRMRDHYLYDAAAMLAAAEWGRTQHGKGSDRVALVGDSMGTWTAMWAANPMPELADKQACLDIGTVVLAAESANHIANDHQIHEAWTSGDDSLKIQAVLGGTFIALAHTVAYHRIAEITSETTGATTIDSVPNIGDVLTDYGVALLEDGIVATGDPTIHPSCLPDRAPLCVSDCLFATAQARWDELVDPPASSPIASLDIWLQKPAIEAFGFYDPPSQVQPTGSDNPLLTLQQQLSPAFSASGVLAPRVLHLLSTHDTHYRQEARDRLHQKVSKLGAVVEAPSIANDAANQPCQHTDYTDAQRPACGYGHIIDELKQHITGGSGN